MKPSHRRLSLALSVLVLALLMGGGFLLRPALKPSPPQPSSVQVAARADGTTSVPTPENQAGPGVPEPAPGQISRPAEPPPGPAPPLVPPTVSIRGTLFDEDGQAVPLARVEAYARSMRGGFTKVVSETDENGSFRADCPVWSRVTFTAHLPGHGRALYSLSVTDSEHVTLATTEFTMKLTAATDHEGTLIHDSGPVGGARLRFHPMSTRFEGGCLNLLNGSIPPDERWDQQCERELYLTDFEGFTDASGAFRADSLLPSIRYVVEMLWEGREPLCFEMDTRRPGGRRYRVGP